MHRVKPQNQGPGQTTRCEVMREVHSLVATFQVPDIVARDRTAKASSVIPFEEGTSASFVRKPRNMRLFSKSVIAAPPEGGQRGLSRVALRDGLGIESLPRGRLRQLLHAASAYLPIADLDLRLLLVLDDLDLALGAAQFAFDL